MWHMEQVSIQNTDEKGTHTKPERCRGGLSAGLTNEKT